MKEIRLSQRNKKSKNRRLVALVDDSDFDFLNQWNWSGCKHRNTYYAHRVDTTGKDRIKIKMHRLLMGVSNPEISIDHKDGDGLNNQRGNLRIATNSQNSMNRRAVKKNTSSKFKGVYLHKKCNKWVAEVGSRNERKYLGLFTTEVEAAGAYNIEAKKLYGEFANLNAI